jgi:hypothetical protein
MQAANENPDASSLHLAVERVDIAGHRFVLCDGRIVVVGVVNSNQVLRHDFSCNGLRAGRLPCLHNIDERPGRNSTKRPRNFSAAAALKECGRVPYAISASRPARCRSQSKCRQSADANFYYSGNTALTLDMKLISETSKLKFAVLCIGGSAHQAVVKILFEKTELS